MTLLFRIVRLSDCFLTVRSLDLQLLQFNVLKHSDLSRVRKRSVGSIGGYTQFAYIDGNKVRSKSTVRVDRDTGATSWAEPVFRLLRAPIITFHRVLASQIHDVFSRWIHKCVPITDTDTAITVRDLVLVQRRQMNLELDGCAVTVAVIPPRRYVW